jgi:putative ABC transport system permease protein
MVLAMAGVGIGLLGALAIMRLMNSLLFGVKATDPLTFIAIALLLSAVALVASYVPAQRAARVDPIISLRCE